MQIQTTGNLTPAEIIEYLRAVSDMTNDRKTLAYVNMAIARQQKIDWAVTAALKSVGIGQ